MEFNPHNTVVQLCQQGTNLEDQGQPDAAADRFLQAWEGAANEFEKFIAAWFVARCQPNAAEQLKWYETALALARQLDNEAVQAAFPALYQKIAACYEALARTSVSQPADQGPFYHGTRADLKADDLLTAGRTSNYQPDLVMNHIYFTAQVNGAGLAAALARGEGPERVYIVEPSGSFEDDPNVTNQKFPGNPTRSYRTAEPLKVIDEISDWQRMTPQQLQQWREKLAANKGAIIN
ncbi:MAG TPA: NAD(+)--rifampin ADP-ribosyltransferase [Mucilaginibacter sp.]|nr:NAD(+)--rifampin ADP-ribosyltransferase [Mucilaginibacter sp.]